RYFNSRSTPQNQWTFSYKDYSIDAPNNWPHDIHFPDGRVIDYNNPCTSGFEESVSFGSPAVVTLSDGGKVLLNEYTNVYSGSEGWYYLPVSIVDPYGQTTTITYVIAGYDSNGNPKYLIDRIIEPGG